MALQKQQVSLDLIAGTETKINGQINDKYQDMINVVFSGDTTAKKMDGYNLLNSLPANEYYSGLFTRGNELLSQTEKGTYKYYENTQTFEKIDEIGSSEVNQLSSYGQIYVSGINYDMFISMVNRGTNFVSNSCFVLTFTDKQGNVLNTIETKCNLPSHLSLNDSETFQWVQGASLTFTNTITPSTSDTFYALLFDTNGKVTLNTFDYVLSDNIFLHTNTITTIYNYLNLISSDIYADPESVTGGNYPGFYWAFNYAGSSSPTVGAQQTLITYKPIIGILPLAITAGSKNIYGSIEFKKRDTTSFYLSSSTASYTGTLVGNSTDLVQQIYTIPSDASLVVVPGAVATMFTTNGQIPSFVNYPTSDTTCVFMFFIPQSINPTTPPNTFLPFTYGDSVFCQQTGNSVGVTPSLDMSEVQGGSALGGYIACGLLPVSEIFEENNEYYIHCVSQFGLKMINFIIKISTGSPIATFQSTKASQGGEKDINGFSIAGTNAVYAWNLQNTTTTYVMHKIRKDLDGWRVGTRQILLFTGADLAAPGLFSINLDASLTNTQYELTNKSTIFNGQPAYYDGVDFSEFGFNNAPVITDVTNGTSGGAPFLPASTSYQLVSVFRWKDSAGNIFYSDLSNIAGLGNGITTSGSEYLDVIVRLPIITTKKNIEVLLYIKSGSDPFHLLPNGIQYLSPNTSSNQYSDIWSFSFRAGSYSTANLQPLYATGTFVAGGDYPTSALTDTIASAIFADRFFSISRDNQISIAYSQQKIAGIGTEFNEDIFYLDVYDKRGVYEDKLNGLIAMDGRLLIFKDRSILYITGSGPSRANTQDDFSDPQLITTDVGCIYPKSIVLAPDGVMFMSDKGIYLLNRKLQVSYIGSSVERFNDRTVTSAILLEHVNEVRFTTVEGELLVYNYYSSAWSWFTNIPSLGACIWKGQYTVLMADGSVYVETGDHKKFVANGTSTAIIQKISIPWIRVQEKQSWEKVYELLILGYFKSLHQIKISFFYDYELYASEVYTLDPLDPSQYNITVRPTNTETESGTKTDGVYQISIDMIRKNCQAFRVEIEDIPLSIASNTGESFALSNITVTFGAKKGPAKIPNAKTY